VGLTERSLLVVRLHRLVAPVLATALVVAANGAVAAADTADVRVLHASPDAPAVDVYLDDAIVDALTNVAFGTTSDYLPIPAGDHNIKVYATGTTADPVIDADVTVAAGKAYTVAATGALADIGAQVLEDAPAPVASAAKVRVVHFSADAPAVDIATAGSDVDEAVVKGLAYPDATGYLELPGGTYDLEVRLAGETTVALALPDVAIQDGRAYSVFAVGSAATPAVGGNALQAVVAADATVSPAGTAPPTDTITDGGRSTPASIAPVLVASFLGSIAFLVVASRGRRSAHD
jgi:hypothetical protein